MALGLVLLLQNGLALDDDHLRDALEDYHQLAGKYFSLHTCTSILVIQSKILDLQSYGEVGRTFYSSNISLVITYVTIIVAALMLAGFLWMAFAYSGNNNSYGRRKRSDDHTFDQGRMMFFSRTYVFAIVEFYCYTLSNIILLAATALINTAGLAATLNRFVP